jgi:uncharacterized protein YdeI (YjbR/CyaY-like superfamily)
MYSDESEYGLQMPEEFQSALDTDPMAFEHFKNLTPGKQCNLLYIAGNVKNLDNRISRSITITEHLNLMNGKIDFKILNLAIIKANQKF